MGAATSEFLGLDNLLFPVPPVSYDSLDHRLLWLKTDRGCCVPALLTRKRDWSVPSDTSYSSAPRSMMIYFHANACDIGMAAPEAEWITHHTGMEVLIPEYPGYGLLDAYRPSIRGINRAARAALRYVMRDLRIPPSRIVIFGRSLGTGPACCMVRESHQMGLPVGSVILAAPYLKLTTLVAQHTHEMAANLLDDDWDNQSVLESCGDVSVLIIHGRSDRIVPFVHGRALYACASSNRKIGFFPDWLSHNNCQSHEVFDCMKHFLQKSKQIPGNAELLVGYQFSQECPGGENLLLAEGFHGRCDTEEGAQAIKAHEEQKRPASMEEKGTGMMTKSSCFDSAIDVGQKRVVDRLLGSNSVEQKSVADKDDNRHVVVPKSAEPSCAATGNMGQHLCEKHDVKQALHALDHMYWEDGGVQRVFGREWPTGGNLLVENLFSDVGAEEEVNISYRHSDSDSGEEEEVNAVVPDAVQSTCTAGGNIARLWAEDAVNQSRDALFQLFWEDGGVQRVFGKACPGGRLPCGNHNVGSQLWEEQRAQDVLNHVYWVDGGVERVFGQEHPTANLRLFMKDFFLLQNKKKEGNDVVARSSSSCPDSFLRHVMPKSSSGSRAPMGNMVPKST